MTPEIANFWTLHLLALSAFVCGIHTISMVNLRISEMSNTCADEQTKKLVMERSRYFFYSGCLTVLAIVVGVLLAVLAFRSLDAVSMASTGVAQ